MVHVKFAHDAGIWLRLWSTPATACAHLSAATDGWPSQLAGHIDQKVITGAPLWFNTGGQTDI